jgi:hypothetical protein
MQERKINYFGFSITNWYRHSRNLNDTQKGILISAIVAYMDNDSYTIVDTTVLQRYNDCIDDIKFMKERAINISLRNSENQKKRWENQEKKTKKKYNRNTTVIRPYASGTPNENENENVNDNDNKNKKYKYGEFQNVKLTTEEYSKLTNKISNLEEWILKLDRYIEQKGAKYKSHYLTILTWYEKDNPKQVVETNKPIDYESDEHLEYLNKEYWSERE